ncbi:hypothetical protein NS365_01470 [Aureimonas ureilytica]|uniref:Polysaccharide biosynthesis protein GtrA n=1 Tax=Aureimonas ureilytica TaxID=401562 RepID=A0A175RZJ0_9HYPH|nr:hypothetical protein NS365_01470 [Aureimonas ureilytica]
MVSETAFPLSSRRIIRRALVYGALTIAVICLMTLPSATDYVGADNDDAMRLVEVRDYLAGQGWFDLMQYRLGPPPGVLMHWSRLIDAPIALLISLFGLVVSHGWAEALALALWPLALTLPVLAAFGAAGQAIGGRLTSHAAFLLTGFYLAFSNRFLPGAIDHHNAQLALVAVVTAVLVARPGWWGYAGAGIAASLALAIGAETTPLIAAACAVVALFWAVEGRTFRAQAIGFSLALALGNTVLYVATVPPTRYFVVTCDNFSFGYCTLAVFGGASLALAAFLASARTRGTRWACLAAIGALTLGLARWIAPQCLGNPLANLDPLLVTLWLDKVSEARSIVAFAQTEPDMLGAFYAPALLALLVCGWRLIRRDRIAFHATMGALLLVSLAIAVVQVRGTMFSNLLSIPPLALWITDLRARYLLAKGQFAPALAYGLAVLCAPSTTWALAGKLLLRPESIASPASAANPYGLASEACHGAAALTPLATLPPTVVSADPDSGSWLLRFTPHRVLSAPYHRNQAGMLAELKIARAKPSEAEALLRAAHVGIVAVCPSVEAARALPTDDGSGLYARLAAGDSVNYLTPLPSSGGLKVFLVKPPS